MTIFVQTAVLLFARENLIDMIWDLDQIISDGYRIFIPYMKGEVDPVVLLVFISQASDEVFEILLPKPGMSLRTLRLCR